MGKEQVKVSLFKSDMIVFRSDPNHCSGEGLWLINTALVRVSIPAETSWPRSKLGRKGFIELTLPHSCSSHKEVRTGTQAGQEAGADAEAMEGCSLVAYTACSLVEPKNTSPEMVSPTRGPLPLDHKLRNCPTAGSHGGTSPTEVLFLW